MHNSKRYVRTLTLLGTAIVLVATFVVAALPALASPDDLASTKIVAASTGMPALQTSQTRLTWIAKPNMPTARQELGAAMHDARVLAVGGRDGSNVLSTVEAYDPATNSWETWPSLPTGRYALGVVAGHNFGLYAIGGRTSASDPTQWSAEVDELVAGGWTRKHDLAIPFAGGSVVLGGDDNIYAFGDNGVCVAYNIDRDTSHTCAQVPIPVASSAAAGTGGMGPNTFGWGPRPAYIMGGNQNCVPVSANQQFDPTTGTYTQKASMPTPRSNLAAVTAKNGRIYAIGGFAGTCANEVATVEEYDPTSDTWTTMSSLHTARMGLSAAASSTGLIYAVGGGDSTGALSTLEVGVISP